MKKLMVAIAAAASAFGLYAADVTVGTSFEALNIGPFNKNMSDDGVSITDTWWFSEESEVDGSVTAYESGEAYAGERPAQFEGQANEKYLALETARPLYRGVTLNQNPTSAASADEAFTAHEIGAGFYVDQLVKFTAPSDSEATINLDGGKVAVWLQEVEVAENVTETNLMVTAGFFTEGNVTVQTNYIAKLANDASAASLIGSWHRVTIKVIGATDNVAGFIVYIDGVAVTTDDAIIADGVEPTFSTVAQGYVAAKQLFPSAVCEGGYAQTIAAVGFQGSGSVDDVSLTTVAPAFAADAKTFDLDWDPAAFDAISAGGQVLNVADGSTNLTLETAATTLAIVATPKAGYTVSLESDDCDVDGMTFTNITGPSAGSIVASFNYFEVNGTGYATFSAALAAANAGDTITLKADCTIDAKTIPETGIAVNKDVTLDLAGNSLLVDDEMVLFEVSAAFTVVNSGSKDAVIGIADVEEANVFTTLTGGTITIGTAANQAKFVVVQGAASDGDAPVIYQGKFLKSLNTDSDNFAWLDGVPESGYIVTFDSNYWIVKKEGGEPEPDPVNDDPEKIDPAQTAGDRYGDKVPTTLANVSAKAICTWAQGNGGLKAGDAILENAFLLNCANTEDAIEEAKKAFKITSITIAADGTVEIGVPDGGFNGTIKKFGKVELTDAEWLEDLDGKKFFEIKLVPNNL